MLGEYVSINESRLYLVDIATGAKAKLLPLKDERSTFQGIAFSQDGKGIYLITNQGSEFNKLAFYDLSSKKLTVISSKINWDVQEADLSEDGTQLAFSTNENGASKLYLLSTATQQYTAIPSLPTGVISGIKWSNDSKSLGFTLATYNSAGDVFEYNTATKNLIRWTKSELGDVDASSLQEPQLISWKSFDQRSISGYLYPASSKFSGKRPVIINIHGGPEGQSLPLFLSRSNYFLNELGISIIYPNVRGSTGYGKTFVDLDNGMKREESVKDIGALIDWIATQPNLDKDRIMITGVSYGAI